MDEEIVYEKPVIIKSQSTAATADSIGNSDDIGESDHIMFVPEGDKVDIDLSIMGN